MLLVFLRSRIFLRIFLLFLTQIMRTIASHPIDRFNNRFRFQLHNNAPHMTKLLLDIGQDLVQESTYCDIVHARNLPETPKNIETYKQVITAPCFIFYGCYQVFETNERCVCIKQSINRRESCHTKVNTSSLSIAETNFHCIMKKLISAKGQ